MAPNVLPIDDAALERDGFAVVPELVSSSEVEAFKGAMAAFCRAYLDRRGEVTDSKDPFVAILQRDQEWRETLFPLLRNLRVVQRIASQVAASIEASGAYERWGYQVPLAWPSFRADPPQEDTYLLPMHQDYGSTRCHKALRLWIPLRDADLMSGTIDVVPGSHKLGPLEYDMSDPKYPHVPEEHWRHLRVTTIEVPAGTGVLMNPLMLHRSVMGRSGRMKYVLLMQLQDLTTIMDPSDDEDDLGRVFRELTAERAAAQRSSSR